MKKRIYIAGKVTGLDYEAVRLQFNWAETSLKQQGHEVFNPLKIVNNEKCTWHIAMRKCIAALMGADAIYMLKGWQQSEGASLEFYISTKLDIEVIYQ